jgi:hypothetical protein
MATKIRTRQCRVPTLIQYRYILKYAQDKRNISRDL